MRQIFVQKFLTLTQGLFVTVNFLDRLERTGYDRLYNQGMRHGQINFIDNP